MRNHLYKLFSYVWRLQFLYENNFFYPIVKQKTYGFSEYIASVGGLLGLIAGISAISLTEFAFHLLRALTNKLSSKVYPTDKKKPSKEEGWGTKNNLWYQCSHYVLNYIKKSSIHGFHQTTNRKFGHFERIFWTTCVLMSAVLCIIFVFETAEHAASNPAVFEIDTKVWKVEDVN